MPFAEELIGALTTRDLIRAIHEAAPDAELTALRAAPDALGLLSLRQRADLLRDALLTDLPGSYDEFAEVMRAARDGAAPFTGWLIWPVTSAVARKAIEEDTDAAFDSAMALLANLTSRLTSEFALRTLLAHDLPRALEIIGDWTRSDDVDVRRLASEGTRPYLPWAIRVPALTVTPGATVPVLDALYRDPGEYVRRSVANHLNDLSRDHPDLVVTVAGRWLDAPDANTQRVVRHGLRTLVKRGHPGALALLGFAPATLDVTGPTLSTTSIPFGGSIGFHASIRNVGTEPAKLSIDYVVHHQKADGRQTGKAFKLTTRTLAPGEVFEVAREHSFRQITTRRYHPGAHAIELQINGVATERAGFDIDAPLDSAE